MSLHLKRKYHNVKKENTSLAVSVCTGKMAKMLDSPPAALLKMMLLSVQTEGSFISADHLSLQSCTVCVVCALAEIDEFRKAEPQLIL